MTDAVGAAPQCSFKNIGRVGKRETELLTRYTPPHMYMFTNTVVLSGSTMVYWLALVFMRYARMPGMRLSDW
jgi:hypothetical protein